MRSELLLGENKNQEKKLKRLEIISEIICIKVSINTGYALITNLRSLQIF